MCLYRYFTAFKNVFKILNFLGGETLFGPLCPTPYSSTNPGQILKNILAELVACHYRVKYLALGREVNKIKFNNRLDSRSGLLR